MRTSIFREFPLLLFFSLFFLLNSSFAQHFVKMTDQQWIELAIDMIRKGIQQQDTTKVFMVFAPEVSVKGKGIEPEATLSRELQTIFANSYKRENRLEKPPFPRVDNPLHLSNFWDFDILDPKIKIEGDSAIVECELVLWRDTAKVGSDRAGRRTKERFIFKSPPQQAQLKTEQPPPSGGGGKWPASPSGRIWKDNIRRWKLVRCENLFNFLNQQTMGSREQSRLKEGT